MLQDVQGKKSVDAKKKILKSLGVLMTQIGAATASIAPQVCHNNFVGVPVLLISLEDHGHISNNGWLSWVV